VPYQIWNLKTKKSISSDFWDKSVLMVMLSIMVTFYPWLNKLFKSCSLKDSSKYYLLLRLLPWVLTCLRKLLYLTLLKKLQVQVDSWDFWTLRNMFRCQGEQVVEAWIKKELSSLLLKIQMLYLKLHKCKKWSIIQVNVYNQNSRLLIKLS
jgi:hypothetical protein